MRIIVRRLYYSLFLIQYSEHVGQGAGLHLSERELLIFPDDIPEFFPETFPGRSL